MGRQSFIAGQVFYHPKNKPHTKLINQQIKKLPTVFPFTGYVSANDLTTDDNTHFNNQGMKLLGQRYAVEMLRIQTEQ